MKPLGVLQSALRAGVSTTTVDLRNRHKLVFDANTADGGEAHCTCGKWRCEWKGKRTVERIEFLHEGHVAMPYVPTGFNVQPKMQEKEEE